MYKGTSWNIIQTENCRIVPRLESHKLYSSLCVYQHRTASVLDPCCLLYNPLLVFKHLSGLLYGCASENLNLSLRWSFKADWIRYLFYWLLVQVQRITFMTEKINKLATLCPWWCFHRVDIRYECGTVVGTVEIAGLFWYLRNFWWVSCCMKSLYFNI